MGEFVGKGAGVCLRGVQEHRVRHIALHRQDVELDAMDLRRTVLVPPIPGDLNAVAVLGHPAEPLHDQPGHRVIVLVLRQGHTGGRADLVETQAGRDLPAAIGLLLGGLLLLITLVPDLSDDLLSDILEGDDAGNAAVLVDDNGDLAV